MEQTYIVILRLFHIFTGVFWAGSTLYMARFVIPAAKKLGPDGGRFMQALASTNNLPLALLGASTLNVLSGLLLFWEFTDGFTNDFMSTHYGMTLSIGGLSALIAYGIGFTVNRPAAFKMSKLAKEVAAGGGPPTADQMKAIEAARQKIISGTNWVAVFLAIAVITMAIGRYL